MNPGKTAMPTLFNRNRPATALVAVAFLGLSLSAPGADRLDELEGSYWLTPEISVEIGQTESGWVFRMGTDEDHDIVPGEGSGWRVPALDIAISGIGRNDGTRLVLSRYGESVLLAPGDFPGSVTGPGASVPEKVAAWTPRLMIAHHVPGVSIAVARDHNLSWTGQYGTTAHGETNPVAVDTVFEAASMSKPFYAYVVLQWVEEGILDLDTPLVEYLGEPYIDDDPRHKKITARMVLSHTGGFPNWRRGNPLRVGFDPGTEFQYSGEGFLFLQRVVEKLTDTPMESMMQERLIRPLGMANTSYVWQDAHRVLAAAGHNRDGHVMEGDRRIYTSPNSAFTLYTTPSEYALFLLEMMRPDRSGSHSLSPETLEEMLSIQSEVTGRDPILRRNGESGGSVYFGLGGRIEKIGDGIRYCHSGSNRTGFRCLSEFNPETGNAIVIMTSGVGGARLRTELIRRLDVL